MKPKIFARFDLSNRQINITIRSRLLMLSGILLITLLGSNLFLRSQIVASNEVFRQQAEIEQSATSARSALRELGELKFWLTDLEVSWLNESEDNAINAQERLEQHLAEMEPLFPEEVSEVRRLSAELFDTSIQAVDAYVDGNRVLGNSLGANARLSIQSADKILFDVAEALKRDAEIARDGAIEEGDVAAYIAVVMLTVTTLFAAVLTWLILQSILKPMRQLVSAMSSLAEGDNSVDIPNRDAKDELGEMAVAVEIFKNNAIENKRLEAESESARQEREKQEQLAREEKQKQDEEMQLKEQKTREQRRKEMLRLADQFENSVASVLDSVTGAIDELSGTANNMSDAANVTSELSESASGATKSAGSNVQSVAAAAEEMCASIGEISRRVDQASKVAGSAVERTSAAAAQVEGLSDNAGKIRKIIVLINEIAEQTNLLALNATIEAARAGDAGKGFAVVASEVKSLAGQTAKAIQEITNQVEDIEGSTQKVVKAVAAIGEAITEVDSIAGEISASVEEQNAVTAEISRSASEAATGASDATNNVSEVSVKAVETKGAASQVLSCSSTLSDQAKDLKAVMENFLKEVRAA